MLRQARGNAKAQQPDSARLRLDEDIARLEIFVNETACMQARERRSKRDGNLQDFHQLQRLRKQAIQKLTAWVREHEHRAATLAKELQRLNRPFRSKFVLEAILMFEPPEARRRGMFRGKG
jgi:hypothetical protein